MDIKPIRTDKDYYQALERLNKIFDSPAKSPEGDEAETLSMLIEAYEEKYFPLESDNPKKVN